MKDKKFYERVKGSLLLRLTDGRVMTYDEYLEAAKEKNENTVYYATDAALQAQYISMFTAEGINVALFDRPIESQFCTMLEQYMENVKFMRVDAEIAEGLKGDATVTENEELRALFVKISGNDNLSVKFDSLKDSSVPALLNVSEESRRMEEMMRFYGMAQGDMPTATVMVINTSSPLIAKLSEALADDKAKAETIASYIYKVSLLSQKKFSAEEMQSFLADSFDILMKI